MPLKIAHKLTHKVINPQNIERTNVKLAGAIFHESTLMALNFYTNNGYPQFKETACFIKIILDWFDTINVKTPGYEVRKKNEKKAAIWMENRVRILNFLEKFSSWLVKWQENGNRQGLSRETFSSLIHTVNGIIRLAQNLMDKRGLQYILLGKICSDSLEQRFGWYRQLCGANYFNSVPQFLQAEKNIRLRKLVEMGFDMSGIKEIFVDICELQKIQQHHDANDLLEDLDSFSFETDPSENFSNKAIIFYIAGYVAHCILNQSQCTSCNDTISQGKAQLQLEFDEDDPTIAERKAKEELIEAVNRGGLIKPSDFIYISSIHAFALFSYIIGNSCLRKSLLDKKNSRSIFIEVFKQKLKENDSTAPLLDVKCAKDHLLEKCVSRIAFTAFNVGSKNFISELNDRIHESRKRENTADPKKSTVAKKLKKVNSN